MRVLVVGLGSMGKRRIRCLQALGVEDIVGYDVREDRLVEAENNGIETLPNLEFALMFKWDVVFICTPPDQHENMANLCDMNGIPFFTEAGVFPMDLQNGYPSCTMRHFSGPKKIKELVDDGRIGRPLSFVYHVGQWLPDWHPNEDYRQYYVSKRATGACREIVPFELCWLIWVFGDVTSVMVYKGKLSDLDADIDDVYQLLLEFDSGVHGMLQVDVQAHQATRHIHVVGSESDIVMDIKADESFYMNETRAFLDAVTGKAPWGYSYADEARVLSVLTAAEQSHEAGRRIQL